VRTGERDGYVLEAELLEVFTQLDLQRTCWIAERRPQLLLASPVRMHDECSFADVIRPPNPFLHLPAIILHASRSQERIRHILLNTPLPAWCASGGSTMDEE